MNIQQHDGVASRLLNNLKAARQPAEAARYALVRRLSPALRHRIVRNLQPITLVYDVANRRLDEEALDLDLVHKQLDKINGLARTALSECVDISSWLAPEPDMKVTASLGISECIDMVGANLNFRGYRVSNEVPSDSRLQVRRDALRVLFIATLFAITDNNPAPARLTVKLAASASQAVVSIALSPLPDADCQHYEDGYRKLDWSDVQALAFSEGINVTVRGDVVNLHFDVAPGAPQHQ